MRENLPIEVKFSRWVVGDADPYEFDQLTNGMVKVNSVFPSRLATEMFSPWEQTRVLTM